jgi:hypothetical protein
MSTRIKMPKEPSAQQRAQLATAQLRELIAADDAKLLTMAVLEAAAAEALRSAAFRAFVRQTYDELTAQRQSSTRPQRGRGQPSADLVPLPGSEGARFDPFAPLDPYALLRLYGPQQLRAALSGYSSTTLRAAVTAVRQQYPGTRPEDARKQESLIDYLVQQLT